ncbi:hypothetical protein RW64_16685 [Geobacter sulfurreducens]|nr:hypothetical protein RW64_16685 [Geobacter sulfurreducens]
MKVLLVHNFYRTSAPSGENEVYRSERSLLERNGLEVITFERHNDDLDDSTLFSRARVAIGSIWSRQAYQDLSRLIRATKPDLAHFHNTFPQITPSGWAACRDHGVPVVQTLHNYRLICPGALLTRNNEPCDKCIGRLPFPALRYRCYRNSLSATLAQCLTIGRSRFAGSYHRMVDRYLVLTRFAAEQFVASGLPPHLLTIRPNFLDNPPPVGSGGGGYAVYVGRLKGEKGVMGLLRGWRLVGGLELKVVGDGELRQEMEDYVRAHRLPVEFLGLRPRHEVFDIIGRAEMTVIPSVCTEGLPLVLLESFACGTPVVVSRRGGLDEAVTEGCTGLKFTAGDDQDLAGTIQKLLSDRHGLQRMRTAARAEFDQNYTPCAAFEKSFQVYRELIGSKFKY